MKQLLKFSLWLCVLMMMTACHPATSAAPPQTMSSVEIQRYMGTWYEIASFPNRFQRGCRCTQANYELEGDYVRVKNTCVKGQGKEKSVTGKAFVQPQSGNAKLKVQFFWPFKGDYWILFVSDDYQLALVGTPDRQYYWILARKPHITHDELVSLIHRAANQGFAAEKIQMTDQSCIKAH